jgi:hypothetical protein
MNDVPEILLAHHLKALKLPTFLRPKAWTMSDTSPGLLSWS